MTPSTPEPWVDVQTVARHLNYSLPTVRRMAYAGQLPGVHSKNGKRAFWRFKLSQVDAALQAAISSPVVSAKAGRA